MLTPGAYIMRRRQAAGFTISQVVQKLLAHPLARHGASPAEAAMLASHLAMVEADQAYLTPRQAAVVVLAVRFDPEIYEQLFSLHHAGPQNARMWGLSEPQLCRTCACSWHDPCATPHGGCSWAEADLCSACAGAPAGETARERTVRPAPELVS